MKKVCVVIPIHSDEPSAYELVSFRQCFAILGNHPIKIIAPYNLNLLKYRLIIDDFEVISIDPKWQSSLLAYNRLKTSRYFYSLFSEYEFLLTYELDAFVFKDELEYWCSKQYDYIGAPWFEGFDTATLDSKLLGVGNSGFSLRNITSIIKILNKIYYKNPREYQNGRKNLIKSHIKWPLRWLKNKFGENESVQNSGLYEDRFFSEIVPAFANYFKVAPIEEAIKFSFEVQPEILYKINNQVLPMGCHAWWRYNIDFWRPFIVEAGYLI